MLAEKLAGYEKYYNKVSERENEAKAAQAAIDADKPEDPDFIPKLLAAMKQGIKHAEDEMRDWSSVQDGSDGAAYETAIREAAEDLDEWLKHVNWRAYSGNREIASWRIGDGMDKLKTETIKALNSYNPELSIEILKSR